jgi:hypothetical protein
MHVQRKTDVQIIRANKRFRKNNSRPYWGPWEPDAEWTKRMPLKFDPPLTFTFIHCQIKLDKPGDLSDKP